MFQHVYLVHVFPSIVAQSCFSAVFLNTNHELTKHSVPYLAYIIHLNLPFVCVCIYMISVPAASRLRPVYANVLSAETSNKSVWFEGYWRPERQYTNYFLVSSPALFVQARLYLHRAACFLSSPRLCVTLPLANELRPVSKACASLAPRRYGSVPESLVFASRVPGGDGDRRRL